MNFSKSQNGRRGLLGKSVCHPRMRTWVWIPEHTRKLDAASELLQPCIPAGKQEVKTRESLKACGSGIWKGNEQRGSASNTMEGKDKCPRTPFWEFTGKSILSTGPFTLKARLISSAMDSSDTSKKCLIIFLREYIPRSYYFMNNILLTTCYSQIEVTIIC